MKRIALLLLACALLFSCCALAQEENLTIPGRAEIPATLVTPDDVEAFPMVILVHGHGGSRDECYGYPAIAEALAAKGIGSLRIDMPGCGESTESFQLNCLSNMKDDVRTAIAWAQENVKPTALGLFGYSMGGRIALELLAEGDSFDAVAMLAPAADNACLAGMFGTEEEPNKLYDEAKEKGFIVYTTQYGQVQELSQAWYDDLLVYPDSEALIAAAAENFKGPSLVIWAQDDSVVDPAISARVAEVFGAETIDATGNDHSYSFYADDQDEVRAKVVDGTADFFAATLLQEAEEAA